MTLTRIDAADEIVVTLTASAQINEIEALAGELNKVLALPISLISLDLQGISELDITFFQLILAFNKTLTLQGRQLQLHALPNDHIVMTKATLLGIKLEHYLTQIRPS